MPINKIIIPVIFTSFILVSSLLFSFSPVEAADFVEQNCKCKTKPIRHVPKPTPKPSITPTPTPTPIPIPIPTSTPFPEPITPTPTPDLDPTTPDPNPTTPGPSPTTPDPNPTTPVFTPTTPTPTPTPTPVPCLQNAQECTGKIVLPGGLELTYCFSWWVYGIILAVYTILFLIYCGISVKLLLAEEPFKEKSKSLFILLYLIILLPIFLSFLGLLSTVISIIGKGINSIIWSPVSYLLFIILPVGIILIILSLIWADTLTQSIKKSIPQKKSRIRIKRMPKNQKNTTNFPRSRRNKVK